MKKTLKKLREELALAKAAWVAARKSKAADTKTLNDAYLTKLTVIEEAEADGKVDADEIDCPAEGKAADTKDKDSNIVTMTELKAMFGDIGNDIAEKIKTALPKEKQGEVTLESIKSTFEKAISDLDKEDTEGATAADVKNVIAATIKESMASIKQGSKMQHDTDDETHDGKGTTIVKVEIPHSLCKGNLPVHMKQLLNVMTEKHVNLDISDSQLQKAVQLGNRMIGKYIGMAKRGEKALTSTGSATGDEWVPTDLSAELQRRLYLASELAAIMAGREVDMPTQPYEYPLITTNPTFYLETTENTAATATDPGTGKITLDAKKLMGRTDFSYEVDEDSIVPVLSNVQDSLALAAAQAYESVLINGDTTATHMDSDTELVAKAAERAFKGFRKLALAITELKKDLTSGGLSEANLRSMKKAMGKYGVALRDLVWIVGPLGINDMQAIANVSTLEKYGPRATILTGELSSFLGIPIITSEKVREDLNASGVYDGSTVTKGSVVLANLGRFIPGRRRTFTVESFRDVLTQTNRLVASFRRAFVPIETPSATVKSVVVGYNFTA